MSVKKKRRKIIWAVLLVCVVGVGIYASMRPSAAIQYTEETARTQDIQTYYTFSGNVEPDRAQTLYAQAPGTVREWLREEGDRVRDDETLMRSKGGGSVKSSMDGTISDIYVDAGEDYAAGDALVRVADYAHPVIRIKVDEYDVSSLKLGMEVSVKVHATGQTLQGMLTRVAQEATVENDVAYYAAEITVPQDGTLPMGMTCEIAVLHQSALSATTVSAAAIQYDDDSKPYVYVRDGNNKEILRRPVVLGITNGVLVAIEDGLKSGETVLIPPAGMGEMFQQMMRMRRGDATRQ